MPAYTPNKPSVEWYTPGAIIEKARAVMGGIDLDPASCEQAQKTVNAAQYFTKETDGLAQEWRGRVWINPPYGRQIRHWIRKLFNEFESGNVEQAVMIANNATDVAWFQPLWKHSICFPTGRVHFISPNKDGDAPAQGSVISYLGKNNARFAAEFADLGPVFEFAGDGLRRFKALELPQ